MNSPVGCKLFMIMTKTRCTSNITPNFLFRLLNVYKYCQVNVKLGSIRISFYWYWRPKGNDSLFHTVRVKLISQKIGWGPFTAG